MFRRVEPNPPLAPHQMSGSSYKEGILHFSTMGMFYFPVEMHTLRARLCVRMHRLTGVRSWRNKTVLRKGISGSECLTLTCNSQPDWLFCPSSEWVIVTGQRVFPEKDCVDADVCLVVAVCLLSHYCDLQRWEARFLATQDVDVETLSQQLFYWLLWIVVQTSTFPRWWIQRTLMILWLLWFWEEFVLTTKG